MGICLDTEQGQSGGSGGERREGAAWGHEQVADFRYASTPPDGHLPMHNGGHVNFEAPRVPVIFVLGGPGSGKVTHCDNLMQEKKGIVHINMTDLLQQYAIGNDMQDFSQLSSRTVTEVLMLEMKMAPTAKTYLVSGYPRSMRDVVEYSDKIQVVNGVVLISWRQKVLERQIDYGAKLGQVVLSLARMELNNFFKNVMPVADYFDQSNMLIAVNGERHPADVYKDFRAAVMRILGDQDNPPVFANGKVAHVPADVSTEQLPARVSYVEPPTRPAADVITVTARELQHNYSSPVKQGWPRFVWVIGGPGSNKAALCQQALAQLPGWAHFSVGRLLRAAAADTAAPAASEAATIRQCIADGELVPLALVMRLVESQAAAHMSAAGLVVDGFPRNMQQAAEFEAKFRQQPALVLLDCSKLQLGRGRLDDSVSAFRRRLEIFREHSLPMLKAMDNVGRLTIVDGDTDLAPVRDDFTAVLRQHAKLLAENRANGQLPRRPDATLHDLEPAAAATVTALTNNNNNNSNGTIPNGIIDTVSKRVQHAATNGMGPHGTGLGNGFAADLEAQRRPHHLRAAALPVDSHI